VFAGRHPEALCCEVLVREDRELSLDIAERTGVKHESPQAIRIAGGRAVRQLSHRAITAASLEGLLA